MLDVGDDVVDMLDAHRQAHIAIRNTGGELLLFGELRMRRRRRMDGEAPRVADIGDMVVKLQRVDELAPCVLAARQLEADQPAETALEVSVGAFAVDALLLRGMDDPLDLFRVRRKSTTACAFLQCWFMRNASVSMPWMIRKALKGDSAAPRSRSSVTRALMT